MLDPQDEEFDRHLVSLCYIAKEGYEDVTMEMGVLRFYITYAKPTKRPADVDGLCLPSVTLAYMPMRKAGSGRGQIMAYHRQLETLNRQAEDHAVVWLSASVELRRGRGAASAPQGPQACGDRL